VRLLGVRASNWKNKSLLRFKCHMSNCTYLKHITQWVSPHVINHEASQVGFYLPKSYLCPFVIHTSFSRKPLKIWFHHTLVRISKILYRYNQAVYIPFCLASFSTLISESPDSCTRFCFSLLRGTLLHRHLTIFPLIGLWALYCF
jgi:hypothetical protein